MSQTILVVDDEHDIVELVRYHFVQAGFRVHAAADGKQALEMARRERPDLIVLDLMLPLMGGAEVARLLKQDERTRNIPVIMLTARGEEVDRVVGFELGADDYVVKPFSPRELVLRARAVLRREAQEPEEVERPLAFDPLVIDPRLPHGPFEWGGDQPDLHRIQSAVAPRPAARSRLQPRPASQRSLGLRR